MLGRRAFGQIFARVFEIFEDMGISLLLAGDAMQLPPVKQTPLWSTSPLVFEEQEYTAAEGAVAKGVETEGAAAESAPPVATASNKRPNQAETTGYQFYAEPVVPRPTAETSSVP